MKKLRKEVEEIEYQAKKIYIPKDIDPSDLDYNKLSEFINQQMIWKMKSQRLLKAKCIKRFQLFPEDLYQRPKRKTINPRILEA